MVPGSHLRHIVTQLTLRTAIELRELADLSTRETARRMSEYCILISGRWFKGATLDGPWTFVSAMDMPPDASTGALGTVLWDLGKQLHHDSLICTLNAPGVHREIDQP
jgi:hypothetical protein